MNDSALYSQDGVFFHFFKPYTLLHFELNSRLESSTFQIHRRCGGMDPAFPDIGIHPRYGHRLAFWGG